MPASLGRSVRLLLACLVHEVLALNVLQWNPHWQCFESGSRTCQRHAEQTLAQVLTERHVDFANVVELQDPAYVVPDGFAVATQRCGSDDVTLFHDSRRWSVSTKAGAVSGGCMINWDRPFLVQQFDENEAYGSRQVVVVGAHYPHGDHHVALTAALASVVRATGVTAVVLIADTNDGSTISNAQIMSGIQAPPGPLRGTQLRPSCCYNVRFPPPGAFDRVVTNFGPELGTELLLDPLPSWAQVGEMHKPVLAVGPTETTTTTATTVTTTTTTLTTTTSTATAVPPNLPPAAGSGAVASALALLAAFCAARACGRLRSREVEAFNDADSRGPSGHARWRRTGSPRGQERLVANEG